jgi:hypothetical protein
LAKLVDARDLKSFGFLTMPVQFRHPAPKIRNKPGQSSNCCETAISFDSLPFRDGFRYGDKAFLVMQ